MTEYTLNDGATINFTAVPQAYVVGATQRAAIPKTWPMIAASVPQDARRVIFRATQDVIIYWLSSDIILGLALGTYSGTLPAACTYPANTTFDLPIKTSIIYVVRVGVDGVLTINFHG